MMATFRAKRWSTSDGSAPLYLPNRNPLLLAFGPLSVAQHQMVYLPEQLMFGREQRTAGDDPDAGRPTSRKHTLHRFLLDGHRAHKDQISPSQVVVMQV